MIVWVLMEWGNILYAMELELELEREKVCPLS
jgi:hypothetical protein